MHTTFVRALDEFGNQVSVPTDDPLIGDGTYTLLDGVPAVDGYGYALPPTPAAATDTDTGEVLRGHALDDALEAAGLSKSGTVAEKRARLAEHNTNTDES